MSGKRPIFEEVETRQTTGGPGAVDKTKRGATRAIRRWLHVLLLLVTIMVLVGGLTRLTDSGLSITEWKPVTGAIPPMSVEAWETEFGKYKQIPEYQLQNKGMSLAEFKTIYWWEWGHRQLGRVIGLVWALGFFWFLARRAIPVGWTGRLLSLGILGGVQGAIGWWMVSSGLTGRMVDVASYRLALHLGLAFVILGLICWFLFLLRKSPEELLKARRAREAGLGNLAGWLVALLGLQILLGALVAGIDAGRGYIDWPLMGGEFLPSESFDYTPFWSNFFENPALVQFNHRIFGYLVGAFALFAWWRSRQSALKATKNAFDWVLAVTALQMGIGILTVLYAAPWQVAILHQFGAIALLVFALKARFAALYPAGQSLR